MKGSGDKSGNIAVFLFGGLEVRLGVRIIKRFRTQKTGSLLAFLALHPGRTFTREVLIEMFWPGEGNGRMSLSGALSSLRQQLEPPHVAAPGSAVVADRVNVGLTPGAVTTDVARFENLLALAQTAERSRDTAQCRELLAQAVRIYDHNDAGAPGGMLPGFYEEWVLPQQERLAERYVSALRSLAALREDEGDQGEALACLRRVALLEPWNEDVTAEIRRLQPRNAPLVVKPAAATFAVANALAPSGAQTGSSARPVLAPLAPAVSSRTATLVKPAPLQKAQTATAARALLTPSVSDPFEPSPFSLPLPFTRFFGRESDVMHLRWAVGTGAQRLLTLTGPGGVGKTRLALEVARLLQEEEPGEQPTPFPRRIFYAPLAGVATVADLPGALLTIISDALPHMIFASTTATQHAARQSAGVRQDRGESLSSLVGALRQLPFQCILLLDNFEHIADESAAFIEDLLQQVPRLSCLVTSRLKIGISGERVYPVTPLSALPLAATPQRAEENNGSISGDTPLTLSDEAEERHPLATLLQDNPALALFVDRAQAVRTDFQLTTRNAPSVSALVDRLEGIPLALELAAARIALLTPQQILEELTQHRFSLLVSRRVGRPAASRGECGGSDPVRARHRSLWDTLQWSYCLLPPDLQVVFTRLSVFRGGWTIEAAQAVCASLYEGPGRRGCLLDDLAYLCDASLVQAAEMTNEDGPVSSASSEMRFSLLETLREFASEQASADPEAAANASARHAAYFLSVAEAESARLQGSDQADALARLAGERDNLRAALAWAEGATTDDAAHLHIALATAMHGYFSIRGPLTVGRAHLDAALARAGALSGTTIRPGAIADALSAAGVLALRQGDTNTAEARFQECLRACCDQVNLRGMAKAQNNLAIIYSERGDYGRAQKFYTESLARWRDLGETRYSAVVLANLGGIALLQGELDEAASLLGESLALSRGLGDTRRQASALRNLGELAQRRGDRSDACRRYRETLPLLGELKDRLGIACSLLNLGFALAPPDFDQSNRLIGAALAQYKSEGVELTPEWRAEVARQTTASHTAIGKEATEAGRQKGAAEPLERVVQEAMQSEK